MALQILKGDRKKEEQRIESEFKSLTDQSKKKLGL